jgi:hypothetical protein
MEGRESSTRSATGSDKQRPSDSLLPSRRRLACALGVALMKQHPLLVMSTC